jgi:hypothetical protein
MLGSRLEDGKLASVAAGYHGEVLLDQDTSRVLRLTADADDIPKETGITASSVQMDYDFVDVAGGEHLLPSHSDSRMEHGDRKRGNVVTYTAYHKFEVVGLRTINPAGNRMAGKNGNALVTNRRNLSLP